MGVISCRSREASLFRLFEISIRFSKFLSGVIFSRLSRDLLLPYLGHSETHTKAWPSQGVAEPPWSDLAPADRIVRLSIWFGNLWHTNQTAENRFSEPSQIPPESVSGPPRHLAPSRRSWPHSKQHHPPHASNKTLCTPWIRLSRVSKIRSKVAKLLG